ncbi:hypothetical protein BFJ72_g13283 [Fusarium proliferatum]|uniref:Oligopeptide transporter n=1 Tax=Gibberella intermedia TaxID=948311 RepID=A0A420SDA3_GIBIN|nr:hypothetical protein BFJ72_g13283 [Fusarium proliferatum]
MAHIDTQPEKPTGKPKPKADAYAEALEMNTARQADIEVGEVVNEKAPTELEAVDMFKPFPPHDLLPEEPYQLSPRAVITGWLLGALVHASNIYLGLKAGIANDANMFATLLGYLALQGFQKMALPLLGGSFGPREHNIIQTVATATGGLSVIFFAAAPAMYQLGLFTNPREDYGKLAAIAGSAAFFGSAISVPMRRFFVLQFGRELDLVFPSAAAVAASIRQLHLGGKEANLRKSAISLVTSFSASTVWTVGSSYAKGILWDWNITWYIYQWGGYANRAIYAVNWGFFTIEWTPAMIGIGMLVPLNVGLSWLLGYCISYGIIGPIIVSKGLAFGLPYNPKYPDLVTYMALSSEDLVSQPSPRYWLLWPAILVTMCATFTDLLVHWKIFRHALCVGGSRLARYIHDTHTRLGWSFGGDWLVRRAEQYPATSDIVDDASKNELVKFREWGGISLIGLVFSSLVMCLLYDMNFGIVLLTLVLGILFAIIVVVVSGQAGVNPGSIVSSGSQLVVGGALKNSKAVLNTNLLSNLVAGAVSGSISQQAGELTTDFKIGFFLGTSPRAQFYGQLLGVVPAMFLGPGLFVVFTEAYPCIINLKEAATCSFSAPAVQTYSIIATAMVNPQFPVARSSWVFGIIASVVTIGVHLLRHWALVTGRKRLRNWIPNMLMVALGALIPSFQYGFAVSMGAIIAYVWNHRGPKSYAIFMIPVAAGMIAGESIGGIINAVLALAHVSGSEYGTSIGCIGGAC